MEKMKKIRSLVGFGALLVALVLVVLIGSAHASTILDALHPKIVVMGNLNYVEAASSASSPIKVQGSNDQLLGSTQTAATFATAGTVSNQGGLFLWDTDTNSGLEVAGPTHLLGTAAISGTTTLGYTPNQINTQAVTMNTASTTLCAFQNTSGASFIIQSAKLAFAAGNSGTANFNLLFGVTSTAQGTASGALKMYGSTAFATSTSQQLVSSTSTGGILFANGNYFVATASATSTQTGTCHVDYIPF